MSLIPLILQKKKLLDELPEDLILTYDGTGLIFSEDGKQVLTYNGFEEY